MEASINWDGLKMSYKQKGKAILLSIDITGKDPARIVAARNLLATRLFKRMKDNVDYMINYQVRTSLNKTFNRNVTTVSVLAYELELQGDGLVREAA